ncbi:serine-aspartate repeat-containing protein F-like isoform X2 [Patiria miniata]|uniref:Uncharacterized protein n=1 Tax=Patiria miniata TaxID=46514 RepID=A0A913Z0Z7_PATMI|nr:serine-aspartate repeat-containing protein F-like isoform X2 [Patiria miniata]
MMAEEQVKSAEQSGQMAEQHPDNTSVDVVGNAQPDTEQDDSAGITVNEAEENIAENVPEESIVVAENHQAHEAEEPVAETDQCPDHENKTNANKTLSDEEQSDNQQSQDSNPDSPGQDANSNVTLSDKDQSDNQQSQDSNPDSPGQDAKRNVTLSDKDQSDNQQSQDSNPDSPGQDANSNVSQNLNASPSNEDASTSKLDQDADANSPSINEDTNNDSLNQDSDSAAPHQGPDTEPTDQESIPPGQDSSSPGASDPENAEKVPEDSKPDSAQRDPEEADARQSEPQEQDQVLDDEVTEEVVVMSPAGDDSKENQALDNDQAIAEENTSANQVEDAEVAPEDAHDKVSASQQPPDQEPTVEDTPEGAAENLSGSSPAPQSPPVASSNNTPDAVQENNNNEVNSGRQFSSESVRIPTAQGDVGESLSNRGSREDLREPAMYKMRSSLPVDAYGDSKSNRLPALVHPDPRLARSLPAVMDFSSLPAEHHQGVGAHRTRSHIPRIPSASGSAKAEMRDGDVRRALSSAKLPHSVMKMSTVMVSARKRAVLNRNASVFYEEKQQSKVISLDQAINSRPPMPFDLDGPGPWSYSPRNKPLNEDNSPEYTFGHKLNEKSGGGRTAYAKTWFNSNNGFTQKVQYEKRWPSPAHYNSTRPLLGRRKPTMVDYPSFTIGVRSNFSISKIGSENEPGPNEYNRSTSDVATLRTAPSYTISRRHQGTKLWSGNELTPGPGTYNPRWGHSSGAVHHPSFTIQGVRRLKSHQLGPHPTF